MLAHMPQATLSHDFNRVNDVAVAPVYASDFITNAIYTDGSKMTMSIPFGIGVKYKFNYNWAISGELTFRPTFSDALDYSVLDDKDIKMKFNRDILDPDAGKKSLLETGDYLIEAERRKEEFIKSRQVGNVNTKDWVNSVSVILSYSFGRPPCYCD